MMADFITWLFHAGAPYAALGALIIQMVIRIR